METDPHILANYTKDELIRYIIMSSLTRTDKEIFNTLKEGSYNTEYLLSKVHSRSSVQLFLKRALYLKLIKKKYVYVGRRVKAVLLIQDPVEELVIKAKATLEPNSI